MSQARVAQLAERQVSNLNVEGSIPFSCFVSPNIIGSVFMVQSVGI